MGHDAGRLIKGLATLAYMALAELAGVTKTKTLDLAAKGTRVGWGWMCGECGR